MILVVTRNLKLLLCLFLLAAPLTVTAGPFDDLGKILGGGNGNGEEFDFGRLLSSTQKAFGRVSDKDELKIGDEAVAVLLGASPMLENDRIQRYVNMVGNWVAMQTERSRLPWRFGVLDTDDINAFAAPGGYIFITKGLLKSMDSEAELAGALAHETVHVLQRHHLKAVQKSAQIDLVMMMAQYNSDNKNLDKLASGFRELYSRGLDKEDEFEADRMGVVIAARSGYDPFGLPAVLQNLSAMNPEDSKLSFLFSTHPPPDERLNILSLLFDKLDPYANQRQNRERFQQQLTALKDVAR